MPETGQRSLAAIVFTDAVGYTARVGADEDATIASIRRDLELMKDLCGRFEGRVLKSMGDGLMMLFASAVNAVSCALEIQKAIEERAKEDPHGRHMLHRIGVHLGDVLVTDDDAHGEGVNVAARLEERAEPGGICLSQTVYDVVKNRLFLRAAPLGDLQLKNVAEPVTAYRISGLGRARRSPLRVPTWAVAFGSLLVLVVVSIVIAIKANTGSPSASLPNPSDPTSEQMDALDKKINELTKIAQDIDRKNTEVKKREDALKVASDKKTDTVPIPNKPPAPPRADDAPAKGPDVPGVLESTKPKGVTSEAYQTLLKTKKPSYDFGAISQWLAREDPDSEEAKRFAELDNLVKWARDQVAKATPQEPIRFRQGVRRATIIGTDSDGLIIQIAGTTSHKKLEDLTPGEMVFLFQGMLLNKGVPLKERIRLLEAVGSFAGEYDLGTRVGPAEGGIHPGNGDD